jgi:hypothetical protein
VGESWINIKPKGKEYIKNHDVKINLEKLSTIKIDLFFGEDLDFKQYIIKVKREIKDKLLKFILV